MERFRVIEFKSVAREYDVGAATDKQAVERVKNGKPGTVKLIKEKIIDVDYHAEVYQKLEVGADALFVCNQCDKGFREKEIEKSELQKIQSDLKFSHKTSTGWFLYRSFTTAVLPCGHKDTHWVKVKK